jgi:hypothetical protein
MGASSVTGVGQGSADKKGHKGSEHLFVGVEKLIGTRIVLSGSVVLSGSTGAVTFPRTLSGSASDYLVLCNGSSAYAYASSVATTGFTANGTSGNTVVYAVIRRSDATVEVN